MCAESYADEAGFCKAVKLDDVRKNLAGLGYDLQGTYLCNALLYKHLR